MAAELSEQMSNMTISGAEASPANNTNNACHIDEYGAAAASMAIATPHGFYQMDAQGNAIFVGMPAAAAGLSPHGFGYAPFMPYIPNVSMPGMKPNNHNGSSSSPSNSIDGDLHHHQQHHSSPPIVPMLCATNFTDGTMTVPLGPNGAPMHSQQMPHQSHGPFYISQQQPSAPTLAMNGGVTTSPPGFVFSAQGNNFVPLPPMTMPPPPLGYAPSAGNTSGDLAYRFHMEMAAASGVRFVQPVPAPPSAPASADSAALSSHSSSGNSAMPPISGVGPPATAPTSQPPLSTNARFNNYHPRTFGPSARNGYHHRSYTNSANNSYHQRNYHQGQGNRTTTTFYKTELCSSFQKNGSCSYGESCRYAHGQRELRNQNQSNPSYKTKPCRHFLQNGYCGYGDRCLFQHYRNNDQAHDRSFVSVANTSNSGNAEMNNANATPAAQQSSVQKNPSTSTANTYNLHHHSNRTHSNSKRSSVSSAQQPSSSSHNNSYQRAPRLTATNYA